VEYEPGPIKEGIGGKGSGQMRVIPADEITRAIAGLSVEANYYLPADVAAAIEQGRRTEQSILGREMLGQLAENARIARTESTAICQDTGMAVVFMDIGQEVYVDGDLTAAVNAGVARGYADGYLRKSVVDDPLFVRRNTGDNTPAVLHLASVPGDRVRIVLAPKGFGSENMSAVKMLTPAAGVEGVKNFVLDTVLAAGANPCPPMVLGMGIGGTMEKAALLAKKALSRPLDKRNIHPDYARLELELLELVNRTGIGPQGFGGTVTALAVNIEYYPTHIAGMPVAINVSCHATRHAEIEL
jgi:fumarate hydratase subunit alpha